MSDTATAFESWAIVELMGRQRLSGYVTERIVAGAGMLRIDVPAAGDVPAYTRLVAPSALYAINPCTEEIARALAARLQDRPIQAYELKALPSPEPCPHCLCCPCECGDLE